MRLALVDLDHRIAVVRAADDGADCYPHVLRGTLVALFVEPGWHVVVAFDQGVAMRPAVDYVLDQAREWAYEHECLLTVSHAGAVIGTPRP